jgi:hypothetical protein
MLANLSLDNELLREKIAPAGKQPPFGLWKPNP